MKTIFKTQFSAQAVARWLERYLQHDYDARRSSKNWRFLPYITPTTVPQIEDGYIRIELPVETNFETAIGKYLRGTGKSRTIVVEMDAHLQGTTVAFTAQYVSERGLFESMVESFTEWSAIQKSEPQRPTHPTSDPPPMPDRTVYPHGSIRLFYEDLFKWWHEQGAKADYPTIKSLANAYEEIGPKTMQNGHSQYCPVCNG